MSKQSYQADAIRDAMEITCQIYPVYGEMKAPADAPTFHKLLKERRLPYCDPVFQAAYASLCLERGLPNQYITIQMP